MTTINELSKTLHAWMRWMRLQRALTWSLRGLILGLALSLIGGMIGLWQLKLVRNEFLFLVIGCTASTATLAGLIAYFWQIHPVRAAQKFDLIYHLEERVSTAFELSQGSAKTSAELMEKQLADAVNVSHRVRPFRDFALHLKKREIFYASALIVLVGLFWTRGDAAFIAAQQARSVQQAVHAQETRIEQIIKETEANPSLTDEQKKAMTQPLNEALQDLKADPSLEGSVSTLTSTSEKLQSMTDQRAEQTSQALEQAGQTLSEQKGSPLENAGEKLAKGDTVGAANDLKNLDTSKLSASQLDQLADQLETVADAAESSDPGLAAKLREAAQAARSGDTQSAQQALNHASQSMTQTGQQQILNEAAQQAGTDLQQGAGQVLAAGGGAQPSQGQGSSQSGNQNSGSGSGEANGDSSQAGESSSSQIPQNNGPGDGGESAYEQIYAPSLLGGDNGENITLPSSDQNGETVGTGPTSPSNDGTSLVPYTQVFSQYAQANQEAIDSGQVPFQFTSIIRSYFDSITP